MRLTKPLLIAMGAALNAALAGYGFDGGDFDGMDPADFERAREWVIEQQRQRVKRKAGAPMGGNRDPSARRGSRYPRP